MKYHLLQIYSWLSFIHTMVPTQTHQLWQLHSANIYRFSPISPQLPSPTCHLDKHFLSSVVKVLVLMISVLLTDMVWKVICSIPLISPMYLNLLDPYPQIFLIYLSLLPLHSIYFLFLLILLGQGGSTYVPP